MSLFSCRVKEGRVISSLLIPLLLLLACLLILGACDFGSDVPPDGASSAPIRGNGSTSPEVAETPQNPGKIPTPIEDNSIPFSPVPTVPASLVPTFDMTTTWGSQIRMSKISMAYVENYYLTPQTVTPDGRFLICSALSRDFSETGGSQPGKVFMIDLSSHQVTELHHVPRNTIEPYDTSADDNWIVWTEAPQEPGFFSDWVTYAYNRKDHSVKQVAKAPLNKDGMPVIDTDGTAKVDHGIVVWAEAVQGSVHFAVKSADLTTGQVKTLTDNGFLPEISWPYVAWVETQKEPSKQVKGVNKGVITILNLQTGAKKTLNGPDTPKYFAFYNGSLAWITARGKEVILTDVNETYQQTVARAEGDDSFEFPSMNDRLITWGSQSRTAVYDRLQHRLVTLKEGHTGNHFVAARAVVWQEPAPKSTLSQPIFPTINVLDTSQLPTTPAK